MYESEQSETLFVLKFLFLDRLEALERSGKVLLLNIKFREVKLGLEIFGIGQNGLFVMFGGLRLVLA